MRTTSTFYALFKHAHDKSILHPSSAGYPDLKPDETMKRIRKNITITPATSEMLDALAKANQTTVSGMLTQLVIKAHEQTVSKISALPSPSSTAARKNHGT